MGSLFMQNFKRKEIESEEYLRNDFLYILSNPVHHGYTLHPNDWSHSSIHGLINAEQSSTVNEFVSLFFEDIQNVFYCLNHYTQPDSDFEL